MILLAERCVGTSAVIEGGQALIGGVDITVARNYFGSQISSFEMATPPPPGSGSSESNAAPYPGVFIRAPAILAAGPTVQVLGTVIATPCRQAAVTLQELERKIKAGENVVTMGVADALERKDSGGLRYKVVVVQRDNVGKRDSDDNATIHNNSPPVVLNEEDRSRVISLPGASDETNAREVICATRSGNLLCTAFHPELTEDYRWHEYFRDMVRAAKQNA